MTNRVGSTTLGPAENSPYAGCVGCLLYTYNGAAAIGDTITCSGDATATLPAGAIPLSTRVILPTANAGLTFNLGYQSTDGDVTTTNATNLTYFNNATAAATAGQYTSNGTAPYVTIPKPAWLVFTVGGAAITSELVTIRVDFLYPGPPPAAR